MADHARPHIHTHHRNKGHSAVAGVAYRLGLKLYDEHAGQWQDFSGRKSKNVVHGETIAPKGAPAWMSDPAQLWNAVEKAEVQGKAQIARDYRMPVPLGVGEADAISMARDMALHIMKRFDTPVSYAVHRDNVVNLDGNTKPADKTGFHAHIYFPTRAVDRGEGGEGGWLLGRKLTQLSNKRTSSMEVELLNQQWSALANGFAKKAGVDRQFEWKSYLRLGIDKTPNTLRARRFGAKNNWTRPQQKPGMVPALQMSADDVRNRIRARRADVHTKTAANRVRRAARRAADPIHGKKPLLNRVTLVGGRTLRVDSRLRLAELMRNSGPRPTSDAEQAALERSMFLADFIESLLFAQERGRQQQADFEMQMMRESMALDDARARKSVLDGELRRAEAALDRWLQANPLKARLRVPSTDFARLTSTVSDARRRSSKMSATLDSHQQAVAALVHRRSLEEAVHATDLICLMEKMEAYKPDFRSVVQALSIHLDGTQRTDIAQFADRLGVDIADVVSPKRAEAPFSRKIL
jgi:hypothetical protein